MYSKTFVPERYSRISSLLEKVQALEEGGKVVLSGIEKREIGEVRWLLYDWLYHMQLKKQFKLREEDFSLTVERRREAFVNFRVEEPFLPPHLEGIFQEALLCETEEEVLAFLNSDVGIGEEEVRDALLLRWKRVMK